MLTTVILISATVTVGLVAGLLYGFAQAVMPGLGHTDDRTFLAAFQAMDRAIVRPLFAVIFLGALVLTATAALLHLGDPAVLPWTVAALAGYLVVIGITRVVHLPLNAAVARVDLARDGSARAELAAARAQFEPRWVRWHLVRTVVALFALVCLAVALTR